jgi:hypothetical protein
MQMSHKKLKKNVCIIGRIPTLQFSNSELRRAENMRYSMGHSQVGYAVLSALLDVGVIETDITATQRRFSAGKTVSGGVQFSNVLIALVDSVPIASVLLALGISCSLVVVSTLSVSVFDDECPSKGLSKAACGGVI